MRRMDEVRAEKQARHWSMLAEAAELSSECDRARGRHSKGGRSYRERLRGGRGGLAANLRDLERTVPAVRARRTLLPPARTLEDLERELMDQRQRCESVVAALECAAMVERATHRYTDRLEQRAAALARQLRDARARIVELEAAARRPWWSRLLRL